MSHSVVLASAAVTAVLTAAREPGRHQPDQTAISTLLVALRQLVVCDQVRWTRTSLIPSVTITQLRSPAGGSPDDDFEQKVRLDLTHPDNERQFLTFARRAGPPFGDTEDLVLRLLEPHLDAALRRLGFAGPHLTAREIEVLRCVRDGLGNAQIARQLGVAQSTVVKHLEHVFSRSGARSRAEAVLLCAPALN